MTTIVLRHTAGEGQYVFYHINNVWAETKNARRRAAERNDSADTFALYIIFGRTEVRDGDGNILDYLPPYAFNVLPSSEQAEKWTVDIADVVFVDDTGNVSEPPSGDRYTVNSVITCRKGRKIHHLEVTGRGRVID